MTRLFFLKKISLTQNLYAEVDQKSIDKKLNSLNINASQRNAEIWNRKQGGGGKSISINGDVIEKAAINFSSISGSKLPASSLATKSKSHGSSKFRAIGVSVISHPFNPCLLYTSPSPRDATLSRMPSSA